MAPLPANIPDCVKADVVKMEEDLQSDLGREGGDEALWGGRYVVGVGDLEEVEPFGQPLRGDGWADPAVEGRHGPGLGPRLVLRGEAVLLRREADTRSPLEGEIVTGLIIAAVTVIRLRLVSLAQAYLDLLEQTILLH